MAKRWIVVAHRTGARIYENHGPNTGLRLVETLEHPEGHKREREFATDRPGRSFDSARVSRGRHAMSREETQVDRETATFAHLLGETLGAARQRNSFDTLVLVAEPSFLGKLRAALDKPTLNRVENSIHRDLGDLDERRLKEHLEAEILI